MSLPSSAERSFLKNSGNSVERSLRWESSRSSKKGPGEPMMRLRVKSAKVSPAGESLSDRQLHAGVSKRCLAVNM